MFSAFFGDSHAHDKRGHGTDQKLIDDRHANIN
jgi:hypothetical protein